MPDSVLIQQARTRLRRIEGQVRGLQRMLDELDGGPDAAQEVGARARKLLEDGCSKTEVASRLGISRQRVGDLANGRAVPAGEACDNLLTQVLAVRAAVEQVGLLIMEIHLDCCVLDGVDMDETRRRDLRNALKHWSQLSPT
jgi:DNA-binding FrmR family transcriptional regulator